MTKSALTTFIVLIALLKAHSQTFFFQDIVLEKNPTVYKPTDSEKNQDLITVFEKNIYEVAYDSDGQAAIYETTHTLHHVNSIKGIDQVNKVYISLTKVNEEVDVKARCITPDNKVIYFNKSSMKSVENFEDAGPFKIFAIDGVEVGCDVEVLYTNKKQYQVNLYSRVAGSSKILHFEAHILSPKNLVYETKGYNGLNAFKKDTTNKEKNHLVLSQDNIDKVNDERYSLGKSNVMSFISQLMYNYNKGNAKIYTWEIISKDIYNSYYISESSEQKSVLKFLEKNKISKIDGNEGKIKAIESLIKTTFEVSDNFPPENLSKSIDAKKINEANVVRLYIAAFKAMSIPFEFCLTRDRHTIRFDPKFPSYIFASDYLFYFPEYDKLMSPTNIISRYGFPDPDVLGNDGLFVKEVNIGDISTSSSKTKKLKATDYTQSYHNTDVIANLDFSSNSVTLDVTQNLFGYSAYSIQPIYRYLSDEQKEDIKKAYYLSENMENVKNVSVSNIEESDIYVKPLTVKFTGEQNDYLENAGNKFVFKVGLLIGKQAELYQESSRVSPADMGYPHFLKRELIINIPDGYTPSNLNDIVINKTCMIDGKETAVFTSSYQIKDNKIIISVYEDYKLTEYALANFNDFVAVLNAAADFNKKSIVFDKK